MNLRHLTAYLLIFCCANASAQAPNKQLQYLSIALTNSASSYPVVGAAELWKARMHPGFTLGTGFNWKHSDKLAWAQTFKLGYFFHRYIQHAVMLYTESGIRKSYGKCGVSGMLGAGYLHSIPATGRFRQLPNGSYESFGKLGRAQAMLGFTLGLDYPISPSNRIFTRFQTLVQTPFVPGYVPLLPVNQFHLGLTFRFNRQKP